MAVTATSIKTLGGSAFACVTDSVVDNWIAIGGRQLSESVLGDCYDDALTFWVLHHVAISALGQGTGAAGQVGPVTSATVGSVSVSYGGSSATADSGFGNGSYSSTSWGQMLQNLLRGKVTGIGLASSRRASNVYGY